ncbi:MAG TPA: L,D-transpeptidase family protein, partial [Stellaceae bacterium]|nr:L,D-transpeptidase family protein [Stellaceae bacterium]
FLAVALTTQDELVGRPLTQIAHDEDTLLDIARDHDVGYVEMRAANPGIDPWFPGEGRVIRVPTAHLLPRAPHRGIVINLAELRLYYFASTPGPVLSFPIGIGGEGHQTPLGRTTIRAKRVHPSWYPTASERREDPALGSRIAPGPDNPMGDYALYLGWQGYAIHGSNRPFSIGRRDSHGCIRLYDRDIETLFHLASVGTEVRVVDQKIKTGWSEGALYLEIHAGQDEADAVEATGAPRSKPPITADEQIQEAAQGVAIDWARVHRAEEARDGIPVRVSKALDLE